MLLCFMDSINSSTVDHLEVELIWVSKSCFFLQPLFSENKDDIVRDGIHNMSKISYLITDKLEIRKTRNKAISILPVKSPPCCGTP